MPNVRSEVFFGGVAMKENERVLKGLHKPHIIIGTPGRILALVQKKSFESFQPPSIRFRRVRQNARWDWHETTSSEYFHGMQPFKVSYDVLGHFVLECQGRLQEVLQRSFRTLHWQWFQTNPPWFEVILHQARWQWEDQETHSTFGWFRIQPSNCFYQIVTTCLKTQWDHPERKVPFCRMLQINASRSEN